MSQDPSCLRVDGGHATSLPYNYGATRVKEYLSRL